MQNLIISKNAVAIIVLFLSFIGFNVTEEYVLEVVLAVTTIVSFTAMIYHQWIERKESIAFLFKKK